MTPLEYIADDRSVDRRRFLVGGVGALVGSTLLGRATWAARERRSTHGNLVIVQLSGGNDGLSTVVPYGDDAYHRVRDSIRITEDEVLRLDHRRGLHPELKELRRIWDDGTLAIVEGVGYPRPNRSHFKSLDIWHAADPRGRAREEGWVGRLCQVAFGDDAQPNRVVHVGASPPYALHSNRHPAVSFTVPEAYRWIREESDPARSDRTRAERSEPDALAFVRGVARDARASSAAIRGAIADYHPAVEYAADPFSGSLRAAAALVNGDIGCRVVSVAFTGFDTHNDQRRRHDGQMRRLDAGLGALLDDLRASEAGRATTVLVFSEFGRRVAENGSRGTDHGCAGPLFVAGAGVRGGLYGKPPSLIELDEGDLVFTTDFRSAYATLIEHAFGVPHRDVLGQRFPLLRCV